MKTIVQSVLVVLLVCGAAYGADRYVAPATSGSGDGSSWDNASSNINAAVLAATAGCTVYVSNGVYALTNQITITNFTIRSYNNGALDRDGTIINGNYPNATNRCFYLNHAGAVVTGFTITNGFAPTNGFATDYGDQGGGVYITAGTLSNCLVTGNIAISGGGGGVYATGANSMITNCDIIGNIADAGNGDRSRYGGGAMLETSAQMWNCRVMFNQATNYYANGGGVGLNAAFLYNSTIISNSTTCLTGARTYGGGIYTRGSGNIIRNCVIAGNRNMGGGSGGGVSSRDGSAYIDNCTVVTNIPSGIYPEPGTYFINNTIFFRNCNNDVNWSTIAPILTNCCVNQGGLLGSGNITLSPAFVNYAAGDYRLAPWSAGVDAGLTLPWMSTATDRAGQPRLQGPPDMGAYETAGGPAPTYYVARNGQTPVSPYTNGWASAASNIQDAVYSMSGISGITILVSNGVYMLTNQITVDNFTIRSYNNGALDRDGTIINGNYPNVTNRCFYLNDASAVVEGFTITNGFAPTITTVSGGQHGGGVYIAAGTLRDCLVTGNMATNGGGGGVYATGANSLITNCDIIGNNADAASPGGNRTVYGGGAMLQSSAQMWNCRVNFNHARDYNGNYCNGGGVGISAGAAVYNSAIISNTMNLTGGHADGGGIFTAGGTVRNCLITGNSASQAGGIFAGGGMTYLDNCTIDANSGNGIYAGYGSAVGLVVGMKNTICYSNTLSYFNVSKDKVIEITVRSKNVCREEIGCRSLSTGGIQEGEVLESGRAINICASQDFEKSACSGSGIATKNKRNGTSPIW